MTRHISLGNGNLLVNLDEFLQVRDFYFPHVGEENHLLGHAHRFGIFTDNRISWINEKNWIRKVTYKKNTLVSDCSATNKKLKINIKINDCVECNKNIFLRKIIIKNNSNRDKKIKVFFHHDFHLYGDGIGDTTGYEPQKNIIFHYKRKRHFLINAIKKINLNKNKGDISDYSVGKADMRTIEDANDGILEKNPIAHGNVDSIISLSMDIKSKSEECIFYWICCGENFEEVDNLNSFILEKNPDKLLKETELCWLGLANKCKINFQELDQETIDEFKKSILIIRTQIDNNGAILAANDSDNALFNHDTYSYVWTRDGALVSLALQKANYPELAEKFYVFCNGIISNFGCFLHKYNPDGSLGSSWHPWIKNGKSQLPIQEDETALVIYSLWDYYSRTNDKRFIKKLYKSLIIKAADFMVNYIDKKTNLPKESYDLWEERQGIFTFTCSTVYAGLISASNFAKLFKENKKANIYKNTAEKIKKSMIKYLFDKKLNRFLRGVSFDNKKIIKDKTIDSSLYSIFEFGVFKVDDPKVAGTMNAIEQKLWVKTDIGGIARYEHDKLHLATGNKDTPGNPWLICTAWLGKYYVAKAKSKKELNKVLDIIKWLMKNSLSTGVMPEQINPFNGKSTSVSPLTWSHSEFIDLVINYLEKYKKFN